MGGRVIMTSARERLPPPAFWLLLKSSRDVRMLRSSTCITECCVGRMCHSSPGLNNQPAWGSSRTITPNGRMSMEACDRSTSVHRYTRASVPYGNSIEVEGEEKGSNYIC